MDESTTKKIKNRILELFNMLKKHDSNNHFDDGFKAATLDEIIFLRSILSKE